MQTGEPRIGLFGGTFDPPHLGHQRVAETCLQHLELDEVIWIPNSRNPLRRSPVASSVQRLQMVQLAIEGLPGMAVSDIEISREGKSYAVDTVEEMKLVQPGQYWVILGTDALSTFMQWKLPEKLARLARLAVVRRPGTDLELICEKLPEDVVDAIDEIEMRESNASASTIRDLLIRGKEPSQWLNPAVLNYIEERGLYK